jgi:membrane protease YdiL (CAAX protease family)
MPAETTAARSSSPVFGPLRALIRFIFAALFFFLARLLAQHGARGLVSPDWIPLVEQGMFAFLLLFGYAGIGFSLDRQLTPLSQQGWPVRKGWLSETGMGLAFGWAIAVACVLPMVVFGGIAMHLSLHLASFGWLAVDAAYFAFAALAMQIAFRGYPFQCAIRVVGEPSAALIMAVLYGILNASLPESSRASMAVNVVLGLLLAMAYLRTRALWLPLGLQLGWTASRALLFGLPVMGVSSHSPVVQGDPLSPYWMSGGDFGLDGSWLSFAVILIAMPLVYSATSDLSFVHNAPVLEPAGLPVDLDAAAKRQHEAATRPDQPEIKPLVQILPVSASTPMPLASDLDHSLDHGRDAGDSPA